MVGVLGIHRVGGTELAREAELVVRKIDGDDAAGARELFTEASLVAQAFFAGQGFSVQQAQTVTRGTVNLPRMLMRKTLELR